MDPIAKHTPFIDKLEDEQDAGNFEFIEGNMPRIVRAIAQIQDRQFLLAKLESRPREIRERHG